MKLMCLTPCLMLPTNRDINIKCIKEHLVYGFDEYAIYDQCFEEKDYIDGYSYIAHSFTKDGYVKPRNELLKYFYNSDCDYAFWIDANSTISKTCLNDLMTILDALRNNNLPEVDAIFATLGMEIVQSRIEIKQQENFMEEVTLILYMNNPKLSNVSCYLHGTIVKNFKKYYNKEFYIDERCNPKEGVNEDIFFGLTMRTKLKAYLAPTISLNKPGAWASCEYFDSPDGKYHYPVFKHDIIKQYVTEDFADFEPLYDSKTFYPPIVIPRVDQYKENVQPYKPRKKKAQSQYAELF